MTRPVIIVTEHPGRTVGYARVGGEIAAGLAERGWPIRRAASPRVLGVKDALRAAARWAGRGLDRVGRSDAWSSPADAGPLEIGWLVDAPKAGFVYSAPVPATRRLGGSGTDHPKALARCPSVMDLHRRLWVVPCPFDLHLRIDVGSARIPQILHVGAVTSTIEPSELAALVLPLPRERWRSPNTPLIQVAAPYRFVADEPVFMSQLPPFLDHLSTWPGTLVPGRFPIHLWPRILMWAFEWHDTESELKIARGDPWFMVQFDGIDPSRRQRLRHARMTPELREYCSGLDGVASMITGTSSLLDVAAERRPWRLLVPADEG